MRKIVNGKNVEIPNIELFEMAFEGLILNRLASTMVSEKITVSSELANRCIAKYEELYRALPFPLYAVESNLKYSTIAMLMRDELEEVIDIWIDSGLLIQLEDNKALKFIGNTWGIVTIGTKVSDNTEISLYENETGYNEFLWVIQKIMNKQSLKDYYKKFMGQFVAACNNEPMILKWELSRILEFSNVSEKIEFKDNRVVDLDKDKEYFIDIFSTGKKKTGDNEYVFSIGVGNSGLKKQSKYTTTYDFEVYEKDLWSEEDYNSDISKLKKSQVSGLASVFEVVTGKTSLYSNMDRVKYKGIIMNDHLLFTVDGSLYKSTATEYSKPEELARGVEIYSYSNDFIYILRKQVRSSGITKESILSYSVNDGLIRLCKVRFV